ncbi:hypothetical protein [Actinotignum urinale]|uniref:hypothetical protein n=1 Tax=Actinotignum urinale TaxID=190146 RepID=UPI0003B76D54|nr:hypothetical protein [Actinotignum urinale]MDY5161128.1 hypothetical protein [Actinotignum urinale]
MTPEEEAIAHDFEQGWSKERIQKAKITYGPAPAPITSALLNERVTAYARTKGLDPLEVVNDAVEAYLQSA